MFMMKDDYFSTKINQMAKRIFMDDFIESHFNYSVTQNNSKLELSIEMPGLDSSNVNIELAGNYLNVSARGYVDRYRLQENVDKSSIVATMKNGLLVITANLNDDNENKKIIIV